MSCLALLLGGRTLRWGSSFSSYVTSGVASNSLFNGAGMERKDDKDDEAEGVEAGISNAKERLEHYHVARETRSNETRMHEEARGRYFPGQE